MPYFRLNHGLPYWPYVRNFKFMTQKSRSITLSLSRSFQVNEKQLLPHGGEPGRNQVPHLGFDEFKPKENKTKCIVVDSPVGEGADILLLFFLLQEWIRWHRRVSQFVRGEVGVQSAGAEACQISSLNYMFRRTSTWSQVTDWNQRDFPWMNIL